MTHAIEAVDLEFSYNEHKAVAGVSLFVDQGEILGFLGPNGAGKSTTIKMLTGQLTPDAGRITVLGSDLSENKESIQARMGVCFEEKNHYVNMTGRENLAFFARLFGIEELDIDGLLQRVDLADRGDDRVSSYSKGMRQRLMIARAISNDPEVLFLDEPTDGLDPVSAQAIRRVIRDQADKGAAVVLTTHDMVEADQLSDRVAFINEGKVLVTEPPETLKLQYGTRSVRVRVRDGREAVETVIPLDEEGAGARIQELLDQDLMTIHTAEATLEDIFIHMAGRGLE